MDDQLLYLRREHGEVFVTRLPTGQTIPWKPLSVGDFLKYELMFEQKQYAHAYIEDEIFIKCVLDKVLIDSIHQLKAGIVSTVVVTIMTHSGPQSIDELNITLEQNRQLISSAIHELVSTICMGFPAYKPEEVEAMNFQDLMFRAAQAETKLLRSGFLNEPLSFFSKTDEAREENQTERDKRLKENKEMVNRYHEQQGLHIPDSIKNRDSQERITDHPKPPAILTVKPGERTIITKSDMIEHDVLMTGHEQDIVHKIQATDATAKIYKDYLAQLKEGGELKIKTPEERIAAANIRAEENKQKILAHRQQVIENAKKELPELLKVREEARKRKARKNAKRNK